MRESRVRKAFFRSLPGAIRKVMGDVGPQPVLPAAANFARAASRWQAAHGRALGRIAQLVLAFAIGLGVLGQGINAPFIKDAEPQSAQWVADIVDNGNWLLPRDYYHLVNRKPPLFYWLSAIVAKTTGSRVDEARARTVSLVAGAALAVEVMAWTAARLGTCGGWLAFVFLLGTYGYASRATTALTDMLLTWLLFSTYVVLKPQLAPLARSLPVLLPLCCGRGEVRVTAGDGKGEGSDPAVVASAGPATRAESARPSAPSASSDKTDESDSDSEKTAPPKPSSTSPSEPAIAAAPKPAMVASVGSDTRTARPARHDTEGSHSAELPSPSNPSAEHASSVGLVPTQSVNSPAPAPSQRFTSNPPASDESASGGEADSAGPLPLPPEAILLTSGMSRIYDFPARIRRVSVSDTNVADIQVINPHQVMLIGHQPGFASFVVWDRHGNVEERQILTDKRGSQQVMLNVVIAEINRGRLETEGLNYSVAFTKMGISLVGLPGLVATPFGPGSNLSTTGAAGTSSGGILPPGGNLIPLILSPNLTYGLSAQNSNVLTQTFFQFLEDHNLGRVLARPRLLANSGELAKFLSGGEIPIIISQALNTSIVFKQFGTSVTFLPTVFAHHDIQLTVKAEVSSPDFSQGVVENGFSVPAFITRRAQTAVRMQEKQTLIIAGLMLDQTTSNVNKVPFLGDIPFLGYAFRTSSFNHSKTELVMTVTPEIVQPIPASGEVALPTGRPPLSREEIRTVPLNPPDVTRPRLW